MDDDKKTVAELRKKLKKALMDEFNLSARTANEILNLIDEVGAEYQKAKQ